jgi:hypothetical protein
MNFSLLRGWSISIGQDGHFDSAKGGQFHRLFHL